MEITFLREGERKVTAVVRRDDGVTARVPGYGHVMPLPHDMAHYVVERELGLEWGFWARVAAGAVFPGMEVLSGRRRPHATERSRGVQRERTQWMTRAEVLVSAFVELMEQGLDAHPRAACARLAETWSPAGRVRETFEPGDVERVCAALRDAAARWQHVKIGLCLTVVWDANRCGTGKSGAAHRRGAVWLC